MNSAAEFLGTKVTCWPTATVLSTGMATVTPTGQAMPVGVPLALAAVTVQLEKDSLILSSR